MTNRDLNLNFYRDEDWSAQYSYVPQNTLLEPNNVIPSWEFGDEENKEVSGTLRRIRQKYDNIHKTVLAKERELEIKKRDLEQAKNEEAGIEDRVMRKTDGLEGTKSKLDEIQDSHEYQMMVQRSYQHMIQRMQSDLISIQIKFNESQTSHKNKQQVYQDEADKSRQAKQESLQAKHRLEELMRLIDQDHFQRKNRLASVLKSLDNKKAALERRIKRNARQQQIRDQAANDNKDSNELKMQENLLAQKFWSAHLKAKMAKEMSRTAEIEDAFQEIRAKTGFSDVQQIVSKFFTRESTYSQLLQTVSENEDKLDILRHDNEEVTEHLNELQMQDQQPSVAIEGGRSVDPQIHSLHVEIQGAQKNYDKIVETSKKVDLINTNVKDWLNRVIKKIDHQFNENIGAYNEEEKTMNFRFEKVMQAVIKRLDQIVLEDGEEERGFVTSKDFMNDFATEEFLNKNIRVESTKPGYQRMDDDAKTQDGQPGQASRQDGGLGGMVDEDDNMNQLPFELRNERDLIKQRFEAWTAQKRAEEERARRRRL